MQVELPQPSAEEREHSARVAALIGEEIERAGGAIDFARYMEIALYASGLGYYSAGATKLGVAGDFVTAPELGFLFARCIARAVAPVLRETQGDILELGPGSGALAAELLLELERQGTLPTRYRLLEPSADLRARQRATLLQRCPHLEKFALWLDVPPQAPWHGALVANEVVDALPVRLFALRAEGLFARAVGVDDRGAFLWREQIADAALADAVACALDGLEDLVHPYRSEVRPMLAPWFAEVTRSLECGAAWFIDYGYPRRAYYAAQRREGTLRCHYRHRVHDDPLILPGLQDITAWVDFDALAAAALEAGFQILDCDPQAAFLIGNGLDELFAAAYAQAQDETRRYAIAQEVKRLTLPGQMGDAFRVLRLSRGR